MGFINILDYSGTSLVQFISVYSVWNFTVCGSYNSFAHSSVEDCLYLCTIKNGTINILLNVSTVYSISYTPRSRIDVTVPVYLS
jgi:hypothetical protein